MSVLSGTLRITATNTPLTDWVATAHAVSDGHLVGRCQILSEGDAPVPFEIDCGEYLQACLITVAPAMGDGWQPHAAMVEGSLRVPTDNALPIVLLVEHAPAGPDPYDVQVVLFLPLDSDFLDTQGHEVMVEPGTQLVPDKPPQTLDGSQSAQFYADTSALTTGIMATHADFDLGTQDFTLEFWAMPSTQDNREEILLQLSNADGSTTVTVWNNAALGRVRVEISDPWNISGTLHWLTWAHVAVCRQGTVWRVFLDGQLLGMDYGGKDVTGVQSLYVGRGFDANGPRFSGNLARVKMTLRVARYWDSFTPSFLTLAQPAMTGDGEPDWPTVDGDTVIDGDVTWRRIGRIVQPITHGYFLPQAGW